jgi:hypothetical protein
VHGIVVVRVCRDSGSCSCSWIVLVLVLVDAPMATAAEPHASLEDDIPQPNSYRTPREQE